MQYQIQILSNVRIPMRDGVELSAEIYLPPEEDGSWPCILMRSPYANNRSEYDRLKLHVYLDAGYTVVYQLVRGRPPSAGEFEMFFNEAEDGYDSVEWVAAQPWCNGQVAMDGGSYLGTAQYLAAREQPPHLVAILPSVPAGDFFNEVPYIGGGLLLDHIVNWNAMQDGIDIEAREQDILQLMKTVRPLDKLGEEIGIKNAYYYEVLDRETFGSRIPALYYSDEDFRRIAHLPVMTVTGWFDGDQAGSLYYWEGIEKHFPDKSDSYLIIGPWDHGACYLGGETSKGHFDFGEQSKIDIHAERRKFFDSYLKQQTDLMASEPRVKLFVTGINEWRNYSTYPPQSTETPVYLHSAGSANTREGDGELSFIAPAQSQGQEKEQPDHFRFDPLDPVEYQQFGEDVSEMELRPDMLVYTSKALKQPLEIIGQLHMVLYAASNARDTDFVVRIIDVFPDGKAVNLSHGRGVIRARYRNGFEQAGLLEPGKVEQYRMRMNDLGHVFAAGHRIRVEVTSSLFPMLDPNPNTGGDIRSETEMRVAEQTVYHDSLHPSHILLPVMP